MAETSRFQRFHYLLLLVFSLILPTLDIYIDFIFASILLSHGSTPEVVTMGGLMFLPIINAILFTLPHWYKTETTHFKRMITLPLVILNLYTGYRALRVSYFALTKQENKAKQKKLALRTAICYVEPFINSKTQILIQSIFISLLTDSNNTNVFNGIDKVASELNVHPFLVAFSLILSLVSANMGLARYLMYGPIRLYPTDGFFHKRLVVPICGIFFIGLLTFFGRHYWLFSNLAQFNKIEDIGYIVLAWFALCILPQFMLVVLPLLVQFKFLSVVQLICKFPGVLIISIISPFTIGIEKVPFTKYILVTKKMTAINFFTSLVCTNAGIWIFELLIDNNSNAIFHSVMCSGLQIAAYLMILVLFHFDKCGIPQVERACINPYSIYSIKDYKDLRGTSEKTDEIETAKCLK